MEKITLEVYCAVEDEAAYRVAGHLEYVQPEQKPIENTK